MEERNAFLERMRVLRDSGKFAEMLEEYGELLRKYPNDVYLLHGKANLLYMQYKKNQDLKLARELLIAECLQGKEKEEHFRYLIERLEGKIALYRKRLAEL